jgi:hypothetical protein
VFLGTVGTMTMLAVEKVPYSLPIWEKDCLFKARLAIAEGLAWCFHLDLVKVIVSKRDYSTLDY